MDAGKGLGPNKAFEVTSQISPFWSKNKALNKEVGRKILSNMEWQEPVKENKRLFF
ncbi:Hypothetical protein FKW44_008263 [Caligus rogercresseyi]|uniref:Uncharacterized protein n=1 Tax=Caligus rogercresseyi TaxID=217165 RepID=A0A7T8KG73_CALRO|nr:Hypothetical protein FKW44_008263 [Caligus rogercresseyi]